MMAPWTLAVLLMLLVTASSEGRAAVMETSSGVFEKGIYETITASFEKSDGSVVPPQPSLVVSPTMAGSYPVLLFVHGTFLQNTDYSDLFHHIASHGYVVVAPQLWSNIISYPSQSEEIEMVVSVANWLPANLQNTLPLDVQGDLSKLAVSGHSRGGKTAFALALGVIQTNLQVQVSALIGVDPVAGTSKNDRTEPHILTYIPNSFNLSIPTMVIGSGLGNRSIIPIFGPACAPNQVNYVEFFSECKGATKFVVTNYGHMDMLDDNLDLISSGASLACVKGSGRKELARRAIGGLVVAYLEASFMDSPSDYIEIINNPSLAPARLYPIEIKNLGDEPQYYLSQL